MLFSGNGLTILSVQPVMDQLFNGGILQQESIVPIGGMNGFEYSAGDGIGQELLLTQWKELVGCNANAKGPGIYLLQCLFDPFPVPAYIMRIHGSAEKIVTKRIEAKSQFLSLVPLIAFASEINDFFIAGFRLILQIGFIVPIREEGKTPGGFHALKTGSRVFLFPAVIVFNAKALGSIKCDTPGRMNRIRGNRNDMIK